MDVNHTADLVTRELLRHSASLVILGQRSEIRIPPAVISMARDAAESKHGGCPTHEQRVDELTDLLELVLENDICLT